VWLQESHITFRPDHRAEGLTLSAPGRNSNARWAREADARRPVLLMTKVIKHAKHFRMACLFLASDEAIFAFTRCAATKQSRRWVRWETHCEFSTRARQYKYPMAASPYQGQHTNERSIQLLLTNFNLTLQVSAPLFNSLPQDEDHRPCLHVHARHARGIVRCWWRL
jgi:hypothetical protein